MYDRVISRAFEILDRANPRICTLGYALSKDTYLWIAPIQGYVPLDSPYPRVRTLELSLSKIRDLLIAVNFPITPFILFLFDFRLTFDTKCSLGDTAVFIKQNPIFHQTMVRTIDYT